MLITELLFGYVCIGVFLVVAALCIGAINKTYHDRRQRESALAAGVFVFCAALFLIAFWPMAGALTLKERRR